jgi:hypothetical protein
MIYGLLQQLQALGLNVPEILKQLGSSNGEDSVTVVGEPKTNESGAVKGTEKEQI